MHIELRTISVPVICIDEGDSVEEVIEKARTTEDVAYFVREVEHFRISLMEDPGRVLEVTEDVLRRTMAE